jgi:hypothetical protein
MKQLFLGLEHTNAAIYKNCKQQKKNKNYLILTNHSSSEISSIIFVNP